MICDVKEGTRNHTNLSLPLSIDLGFRTNTGMNIGAWDWAWRATKKASRFLFLQDEVEILRPGWLSAFTLAHLAHRNENGERPLLLGESWNHRWDQPWDTLSQSELNSPNKSQHYQGTIASKGNVDFVRNLLADWSIEEGVTGGHLRSLIWYTDLKSLEKINGFHVGQTRGECIAAEIAASKAIATSGGIVRQLRETPFTQLWHREWRKDGISKLSASPAKQVSTRTS
jgi:hypothetical protein